jgi:hypothetical protein
MRRFVFLAVILSVLGASAPGSDLVGMWSTTISLGDGLSSLSVLAFNFGLADWELTTTWTFSELSLSRADLALVGNFGPVGIAAGVSFCLADTAVSSLSSAAFTGISLGGWKFTGGYISFELSLGNFTLKVTFVERTPQYLEK